MRAWTFVGVRKEWDEDDRVPDGGVNWEGFKSSEVLQVIQGLKIPIREQLADEMVENTIMMKRELVNGNIDVLLLRKNRLAGLAGLSAGSTRTLLARGTNTTNFADFESVTADFSSPSERLENSSFRMGVGGESRGSSCNKSEQKWSEFGCVDRWKPGE
ncbi:hypothetical protein K435DRAFT_804581 [Dendrothele bispora CBS 962.96]|uniref:Uncharacterized protein n=1 Tax=Dendrothele bispora (strain CBS 962.96) TaxID=1314807 RepID=A0A4S8LE01_DENBC|nr:hypothetical protein K435DRAFT_804581 [Dendrothele bispora CBS 962.96]